MQKGQINVSTDNIFPIIKKFLYSDQEIFLRELVSNATDATSKIQTISNQSNFEGELGELTIDIKLDKEAKTLTISDRGLGMTEEEVNKYLNQVAFSSAQEFLDKYKDEASIIGHFGLGFYSAFMVADKVEVVTRSYKGPEATKWTCSGDPEYTIESADRDYRGTDIILHISEDSEEFLDDKRIQSLLDKYCKFLPFSIRFGTKTEYFSVGEGDDKKQESKEVDNFINDTNPLWKKKPQDITDEEYKEFYRKLYPASAEPLFWIHLNIDFPFNLTGVLYFPKLNNSLEIQKNKIQLYSNQVYVTDDVSEIVPEFLLLLHGVIDSPDIPLNVSRSYLQSDSNVRKITSYITKKVAEKLKELYKKDSTAYQEKWSDLGVFVKYGMISDEKFYDRSKDFCLMKNVDGEFDLIDKYVEKIKISQTDKNDNSIILYSVNKDGQLSYINSAKNAGYDVLLLDHVIDNHFIQQLEQKLEKVSFKRVDADTIDKLIEKDEAAESVLSEKQEEKVKSLFQTTIGEQMGVNLEMRALSPNDQPVMIVKPEFMRRMTEMQNLQGMGMGSMGEFYNVVVNTNHELVSSKLLKMRSQEKKDSFAKYLVLLAKLNQNMLIGEELTEFTNKSIEFLKD